MAAVLPLGSLPLGFRFHPTDEELVNHYLKRKIDGRIDAAAASVVPVVDLAKSEPWDLPDMSAIKTDDLEWFFFAAKDRKYPGGSRSNRATDAGYWKATGKDRTIRSRPAGQAAVDIGKKKTLVFYKGRAPKGERTGWIMHEYRTVQPEFETGVQGGYVLCRLFKKPVEKNSSTSTDEMEKNVSSPAATVSSVGDGQHAPDLQDEVPTPSNQEFSAADLQEETQPSVDEVVFPTPYPLGAEQGHHISNMASHDGDHRTEVVGEVEDALQEALMQFDSPEYEALSPDGFPGITSPMRPYTDHPFFEDINHGWDPQLCAAFNTQQDSPFEFVDVLPGNQEDHSSEISTSQRDLTAEDAPRMHICTITKASPLESLSGMESALCSDVENEFILSQDNHGLEDLEWLADSPISSRDSLQMNGLSTSNEGISNGDNTNSLFSATHSLHVPCNLKESSKQGNFCNSLDWIEGLGTESDLLLGVVQSGDLKESTSHANLDAFGLEATGIKIRSREPQHLLKSDCSMAQQGTANRRIRLQTSIHIGSTSSIFIGSTGSNNNEHEVEVATHERVQSLDREESTGQENVGAYGFEETGIKIRSREDRQSPESNWSMAQQGWYELQGRFSFDKPTSSNNGEHEVKVAADEEGESAQTDIPGRKVTQLASDELEGLSDDETSSMEMQPTSESPRKSEPELRLRMKRANSAGSKLVQLPDSVRHISGSLLPTKLTVCAVNAKYLVFFFMLILCFGIWWCMSPQLVQAQE